MAIETEIAKSSTPVTTSIEKSWRPSANGLDHPDFVYDEAHERRIRRKCDFRLLPPLMVLFLVNFIDRTNIANAKIEGMTEDLQMGNTGYNKALWLLNIPYILCGVPSNMLMKKNFVKPSTYLSGLIFCWAMCTIGLGITKSLGGVLACRFLMGVFEAGFTPGCAFLIGRYYRRVAFMQRYALFFSSALIAGAFSGLLAFAIENMDGVGGYSGWRWIFLVEGMVSIVAAIVGFFCIPPYPEDSRFLRSEEKEYVLTMLARDEGPSRPNRYDWTVMKGCLVDYKIWLGMIAYLGADNAASSIVSFQPTIIKQMGYTAAEAQVHTIPVYIVGLVCVNLCAFFSDRIKHRFSFLLLGASIGLLGWAIELAQPHSVPAKYFGIFAIASGAYIQMPLLVVWVNNNMGGNARSAFATAFIISLGNCGNLISSNVFITTESPRYPTGYATGLVFTIVSAVFASVMFYCLRLVNRRRENGLEDAKLVLDEETIAKLGDNHPAFRYIL